MRTLVKSLKRLYERGKLTDAQLRQRVESGTITRAEYKEITGQSYDLV